VQALPTAAPESAYTLAKTLISGPLGGVVGGLVSYVVLDVWLKARRSRHALAGALAAEILDNAEDMKAILDDPARNAIPPTFQPRFTIYRAVASRLGELAFADVQRVVTCYVVLEKMEPAPKVFEERVNELRKIIPKRGQPSQMTDEDREWPRRAVQGFYNSLKNHERICRETANYLRSKYFLSAWWQFWRWFKRAPPLPPLRISVPDQPGASR
jgi:hypothetical protein